jgi:hypothetical protein
MEWLRGSKSVVSAVRDEIVVLGNALIGISLEHNSEVHEAKGMHHAH